MGLIAVLRSLRSTPGCRLAPGILLAGLWLAAGGPARAESRPTPLLGTGNAPLIHEYWTVRDGLPVNSVNDICQTKQGYLWLATFDGLVRFDGLHFAVFNRGNTEGLPSNRILRLKESSDGGLFVMNEGGHLSRYRDGRFLTFGPEQGLAHETCEIYRDPDGEIWVGTSGGLFQVEGDRVRPWEAERLNTRVNSVLKDSFGALWAGTRNEGCFRFQDGVCRVLTTADGLADNWVTAFGEDTDGNVWIGTSTGVHRYRNGVLTRVWIDEEKSRFLVRGFFSDPGGRSFLFGTEDRLLAVRDGTPVECAPEERGNLTPLSVAVDAEGHVWFGQDNRLYRDGRLVFEMPVFISGLLADREGSVWVGTVSGGLHRFKQALFQTWSEPEGLSLKNIYTVCETGDGVTWIGTHGRGLSRLHGGIITNFEPPAAPVYVISLCATRDGRLWIGSLGGAGTFENGRYVPRLETFLGRSIRVSSLFEDSRGDLWLGTVGQAVRYRDGVFEPDERIGGGENHVRAIAETRDGALWFGTTGPGLFRLKGGEVETLVARGDLPIDQIRAIHEDRAGIVWVGIEGRGLLRVEMGPTDRLAEAKITSYRKSDGLHDEVIHQILEDDLGRLWMSTNRGLFWVERNHLNEFAAGTRSRIHSVSYSERDGMRNPEANGGSQPAGMRSRDGRLWFPTQDGVVAVDPAQMVRQRALPPVVLERVGSDRRSIIPGAEPIRLAARERQFEIAYTSPTFLEPRNVVFRYRLDGFNADWVDAGNRRVAYYTNVPPGNYVFRVGSASGSDFDPALETTLAVTVAPFFHETPAFYGLVMLALAGTVVFGYRWRMRRAISRERSLAGLVTKRTHDLKLEQERSEAARLEAEAQRQEAERLKAVAEEMLAVTRTQAERLAELDQAKSRFFANVSHEFRTPLTLTIGPLEDLAEGRHGDLPPEAEGQVELALRSSRRLLKLVNQILDLSRLEAGQRKLQAREGDLSEYLVQLAQSFTSLAHRRQVSLQLRPLASPVAVWFDPDLIEAVFLNLLGNAFKFTPEGGTIQVAMSVETPPRTDGAFVVTVRDNGPGIPRDELPRIFERFHQVAPAGRAAPAGTGIGLSLAREVTQLHGGTIEVESEFGFGAAFTVRLPLGTKHLAADQRVTDGAVITPGPPRIRIRDVEESLVEPVPVEETDDADQDRTTILLVDDNSDVRAFLRTQLEETYRVVEAVNGEEGLAAARRVMPDLVLSDVMMPGMDGYAFCEALKRDAELSYIPVILLTARSSDESRVRGLELGADDYLTKPFNRRELLARIRNLIASRRKLHAAPGPELRPTSLPDDIISSDQAFLDRVRSIIESHFEDEEFSVQVLAREVGLDRSQLFRRLRTLLALTPTEVIRTVRLERAARLLERGAGSVSEIGYSVGFKSVSHFSASFRQKYGVTPSAFAARGENPAGTGPPQS